LADFRAPAVPAGDCRPHPAHARHRACDANASHARVPLAVRKLRGAVAAGSLCLLRRARFGCGRDDHLLRARGAANAKSPVEETRGLRMILLLTGQPGHGKTAYAMHRALKLVAEGRLVYAHGIKDLNYETTGFKPLEDPTKWEDLPDG